MTAIALYKKLHSEKNYINEEIEEALTEDSLNDEEKEAHTLCCLELDRKNVFELYFGLAMDGESTTPRNIYNLRIANNLYEKNKIDYCVEHLLQLEGEEKTE